jgi:hypothetical protein
MGRGGAGNECAWSKVGGALPRRLPFKRLKSRTAPPRTGASIGRIDSGSGQNYLCATSLLSLRLSPAPRRAAFFHFPRGGAWLVHRLSFELPWTPGVTRQPRYFDGATFRRGSFLGSTYSMSQGPIALI